MALKNTNHDGLTPCSFAQTVEQEAPDTGSDEGEVATDKPAGDEDTQEDIIADVPDGDLLSDYIESLKGKIVRVGNDEYFVDDKGTFHLIQTHGEPGLQDQTLNVTLLVVTPPVVKRMMGWIGGKLTGTFGKRASNNISLLLSHMLLDIFRMMSRAQC